MHALELTLPRTQVPSDLVAAGICQEDWMKTFDEIHSLLFYNLKTSKRRYRIRRRWFPLIMPGFVSTLLDNSKGQEELGSNFMPLCEIQKVSGIELFLEQVECGVFGLRSVSVTCGIRFMLKQAGHRSQSAILTHNNAQKEGV